MLKRKHCILHSTIGQVILIITNPLHCEGSCDIDLYVVDE